MNYHELSKASIDNYVSTISSVTAADIQNAAKKYLVPEKMTIVVVGDKAKITEQLKPYAN